MIYCKLVIYILIIISMVVLNSRDHHEKYGVSLLRVSITYLTIFFTQKPTEMHW